VLGTWGHLFVHGATVGQLFLVSAVVGLFVVWIWYFTGFIYARCAAAQQLDDRLWHWNSVARTLGQVSSLALALTLYPVTRNSVWSSVFAVPYDRAVRFHRALGVLAWLTITAHMLCWWIKWGQQRILWYNWTHPSGVALADTDRASSNQEHFDNFSVFLVEISWFLLTAMVVVALFFRRHRYELFLYTHHVAIGLVLTVFIHAWSFWYFALPPALLWISDRMLRLHRTTRVPARVQRGGETCGQITRIVFPSAFVPHAVAGQFVWIQVRS
jgi:predicted ferric reductase